MELLNGKIRGIVRAAKIRMERSLREAKWDIAERRARRSWMAPEAIADYRKGIKVVDAFTFFNELDLLELRLNVLDRYVDLFVIVEADRTFSGIPRELCFEANRSRFAKWEHKIRYEKVTDVPKDEDELRTRLEGGTLGGLDRQIAEAALKSSSIGKEASGKAVPTWLREFYVKECIRRPLAGLSDSDFCFVSDLDEIWDPNLGIDYSKDDVFKLRQKGYMYFLNNRSDEDEWFGWLGTIATKYGNIRGACLSDLRTHKIMKSRFTFLRNGGWHFAFQGGLEGARNKLREYGHFWYESDKNLPRLEERFGKNVDFRGKGVRFRKDERGLPAHVLGNREKYKHILR